MPKKANNDGSVYYNKSRSRWTVQYYEVDINTGKRKRRTKDFKTQEEGKKYLQNIMYQKQNSLYIEHNGIPLTELMKANLKLKYDTNLISDAQYVRTLEVIKSIEKSAISSRKIDNLKAEEIQEVQCKMVRDPGRRGRQVQCHHRGHHRPQRHRP